jgi:hypothetical protein
MDSTNDAKKNGTRTKYILCTSVSLKNKNMTSRSTLIHLPLYHLIIRKKSIGIIVINKPLAEIVQYVNEMYSGESE